MELANDRGRILRITFDVIYTTGLLRTVAMNLPDDDWDKAALIALREDGVQNILAPGLEAAVGAEAGKEAVRVFDTQEEGSQFKPAMLIVDGKGNVVPACSRWTCPPPPPPGPIRVRD
jgi:hypothetical protein